jgi:hypothetical protein
MTQKDLFARLGAPLKNVRWSWGSVRSDGTVFLRVWQDEIQQYDGSRYVRVLNTSDPPGQLGYQERLTHIERVKEGAPCYMIMCVAVDENILPRRMKEFIEDEVFPGGKIVKLNGDWWIEVRPRVPVRQVVL